MLVLVFKFDPFLGGGTILIAAARLSRRCVGMKIEQVTDVYSKRRLYTLFRIETILSFREWMVPASVSTIRDVHPSYG
jgi:hypothetical protein